MTDKRAPDGSLFVVYEEGTDSILFMPESTEGIEAGMTTAMDYDTEAKQAKNNEKLEQKLDRLHKNREISSTLREPHLPPISA